MYMYYPKIMSFLVWTKLSIFTESSTKMRIKSEALVARGGGGITPKPYQRDPTQLSPKEKACLSTQISLHLKWKDVV